MPTDAPQLDLSCLEECCAEGLNLDQYLGPWAILEENGRQLWEHVLALGPEGLRAHVSSRLQERTDTIDSRIVSVPLAVPAPDASIAAADTLGGDRLLDRARQIALISITGTMTKRGSSLNQGGSTIRARREIRQAAADPEIDGLVIRFDTPGGTVAGMADLAQDIAAANRRKPVYGFAEDLCASAGYLAASQCRQVFANAASALIGSIGVLLGLYDLSGRAGQMGVKPVVIRSGPLKGVGFEGAEITAEQKAYLQELVDSHHAQFVAAVASGRNQPPETVATWATGRVWPAGQSLAMGLIDGIQSLEQTLQQCAAAAARKPVTPFTRRKDPAAMSAASYQEVVSACTGLDASEAEDAMFLTEQLRLGHDAEQVAKNWMQTLRDRAASARQDLQHSEQARQQAEQQAREQAEQQAREQEQRRSAAPGVDPLIDAGSQSDTSETAAEAFWADVAAAEKKGIPRQRAISQAVQADPARHRQMIADYNAEHAALRR